jgi:predicted  nucleic acid-binding Zn-ribbon protein
MNDLETLHALQVLDSTLDQLTYRRAHLEERAALGAARDAARSARSALAANTGRQDALTARYTELERQTAELESRRARLDAQLKTIVVTREAEALQRQIVGLRAERDGADEEGLVVLDEMEALATAADGLAADLEAAQAAERVAADALADAEAVVDRQLAETRRHREEAAARVPGALLVRYDAMRPSFKGVAVARLDGHSCSGCHITLSRVELESVWAAASGGSFPECPHCGRLLLS